jgi:hypothetical protein
MRYWALVPSGFGFCWFAFGLSSLSWLSSGVWVALFIGALVVAGIGIILGQQSPRLFDRKAFRKALIAEGIGIVVVLLTCNLLQQPSIILPLIGAVVGLHFLPLAKAFGDRTFIMAGCLMAGINLAALFWPSPLRGAISGIGGGVTLWAFALWTSLRSRSLFLQSWR